MSSSKNRRKAAKRLLSLSGGRNKSTAWMNDIEGLVRAKKYHGQTFANIEYSYDANQRLAWRKFWSSPTVSAQTSYGYDDAGNLLSIDYPTSPDVSFTYNENNQQLTMTTAGLGTITNTYTDAGNLWTEGGLWPSDTVTNTYHASVSHLRTGLTLAQPALTWAQSYAYDAADRLETVTSQAGTFTYTYLGPGTLWTNLALPNTSAITNAFDTAGRLTRTALRTSANALLNSHDYLYNTAGQRQRQTLTDGTYTAYGFDDDAQLTNALGFTSAGVPIASQQLGFDYDPGWNMTNRSVNGTPTAYAVNDLNEVTGNGADTLAYDANGNRTVYQAGNKKMFYDDENRLVAWQYIQFGGQNPTPGDLKTDFQYDGLGRLRLRTEYSVPSGYNWWQVQSVTRYIYDGKRVIQERDLNNNPTAAYTRGKDLSGSLEGAGGIGGMLARSYGHSGGSWGTHEFYHADGNGNITCLANIWQQKVGSYKYDAYGRTISGYNAVPNFYRFSSKEVHPNSGFYYYLYRFYDPNTLRWLNRDPIEELDGVNLYEFVKNSPAYHYDPTGLFGDGNDGKCLKGRPKGHSDFYGHNCFNFPAEDHGSTSPYPIIGQPGNHFQDIGQSLRQARAAIAACDADAFARAMHRVQDCFSHSAYSWEPPYCWGHAADGTAPDKSNVAWDRANRMTHRLVDEYIKRCGLPNDHIPIEGTE